VTAAMLKGRAEVLAATYRAIDDRLRFLHLRPETEAENRRAAGAALLRLKEIERKIDAVLSETRDECWGLCDEWCGIGKPTSTKTLSD
jgi:hypothetical protein